MTLLIAINAVFGLLNLTAWFIHRDAENLVIGTLNAAAVAALVFA